MYAVNVVFMSGVNDGLGIWLKSNDGKGYAIENGWEYIIGRSSECDLTILYDTQVSRQHAYMRVLQSEEITLEDEKSRNGIYHNNQILHGKIKIDIKTLFRIGNTWLKIEEIKI